MRCIRLTRPTIVSYEGLLVDATSRTFKCVSSSNGVCGVEQSGGRPERDLLADELMRAIGQIVPEAVRAPSAGVPVRWELGSKHNH